MTASFITSNLVFSLPIQIKKYFNLNKPILVVIELEISITRIIFFIPEDAATYLKII